MWGKKKQTHTKKTCGSKRVKIPLGACSVIQRTVAPSNYFKVHWSLSLAKGPGTERGLFKHFGSTQSNPLCRDSQQLKFQPILYQSIEAGESFNLIELSEAVALRVSNRKLASF